MLRLQKFEDFINDVIKRFFWEDKETGGMTYEQVKMFGRTLWYLHTTINC